MIAQQSEISANPFAVKTPENLCAEELVELFVPYPEFENLQVSGHQFLHGHRGSGKSMMLRMMSPDSQVLWLKRDFSNLPYFGVYLSIKTTELNAPEYVRLENEISGSILSEHVLTTKLLSALFLAINTHCKNHVSETDLVNQLRESVATTVIGKFKYAGWSGLTPIYCELNTFEQILRCVINIIDGIHSSTIQYIKRRSFSNTEEPYQGTLLGFQDVLLPIVQQLTSAKIIPSNAPVYFLLDDADNLSKQQTQVLNTWVSYRTTGIISLKISTQLNYKTLSTTTGIKIEDPHDFSSINFTSVHTGSKKDRYPQLVEEIIKKRLVKYGSDIIDPYIFFPEDEKQSQEISRIAEEIKAKWEPGKSGYRPDDDAYRYARPEYIRLLTEKKQGHTYRYAGFEQLVHISSGIIRFFLEPAARMFTEQLLKNEMKLVSEISPSIQDQELRNQAEQLLLDRLDELEQDSENINADYEQGIDILNPQLAEIKRLRNIVQGIGARFKVNILDENCTQRRVFSFSISGELPDSIKRILKLGVIHGYFYEDSISSKHGLGRQRLYVLTRRLAPAFSLDPIGFSGYLSVKVEDIQEMSEYPQRYINRLRKQGAAALSSDMPSQLSLFIGDSDD